MKNNIIFTVIVISINCAAAKRGPHHPRGDFIVKRSVENQKQEFLEHLAPDDDEHIQEDLTGIHVHHKDVSEMSEDEKSFYYFKVHDSDNNDLLDGLEMIKAAIHRYTGKISYKEDFEHIESVVDEFLEFADMDQDGFLNYPEYMKAMETTTEDRAKALSQPPYKKSEEPVD